MKHESKEHSDGLFEEFMKGHVSQWEGGGTRYAYNDEKEWTDVICEKVGNKWIGGNIIKYAGETYNEVRQGNKAPEVNLMKIAVYAFIWWIKEYKETYTTVLNKRKYYEEFKLKFRTELDSFSGDDFTQEVTHEEVASCVEDFITERDESLLIRMAVLGYVWWLQQYGNFTQRDKGEEF